MEKHHGSWCIVPQAEWFLKNGANTLASIKRVKSSSVVSKLNPPISTPSNGKPEMPIEQIWGRETCKCDHKDWLSPFQQIEYFVVVAKAALVITYGLLFNSLKALETPLTIDSPYILWNSSWYIVLSFTFASTLSGNGPLKEAGSFMSHHIPLTFCSKSHFLVHSLK